MLAHTAVCQVNVCAGYKLNDKRSQTDSTAELKIWVSVPNKNITTIK